MQPPQVPPRERRRTTENLYSRDPTLSRTSRDENQSFLTAPIDESSSIPIMTHRRSRESEIYGEPVNQPTPIPVPAPRNNLNTMYENENLNIIEYEDYFFGKDMSLEMKEKFDAGRDGSYCVRESTKTSGIYVLDIKINGMKKSMTIKYFRNEYYFQDTIRFPSIPELIQYYQNHSLQDVNPILDLKLCYPLSRSTTENVDGIFRKIDSDTKELLTRFSAHIEDYNSCLEESDRINDEIDKYKKRLFREEQYKSAFQTAINWLETTIQNCNNYDRKQLTTKDWDLLKENIIRQENLREEIVEKLKQQIKQIEEIKKYLDVLSKQSQENDERLNNFRQKQEHLEEELKEKEVSQYLITSIRENGCKVFEEWELYKSYLNRDQWYFPKYNSEDAKEALKNCISGTFLIRSTTTKKLGLSVKVKDTVLKCIIEETRNGFGFSEPFDHFKNLEDFVLYYARNNLSFHNQGLDTVLKYPYKYYLDNRDDILEKERENYDNYD